MQSLTEMRPKVYRPLTPGCYSQLATNIAAFAGADASPTRSLQQQELTADDHSNVDMQLEG